MKMSHGVFLPFLIIIKVFCFENSFTHQVKRYGIVFLFLIQKNLDTLLNINLVYSFMPKLKNVGFKIYLV